MPKKVNLRNAKVVAYYDIYDDEEVVGIRPGRDHDFRCSNGEWHDEVTLTDEDTDFLSDLRVLEEFEPLPLSEAVEDAKAFLWSTPSKLPQIAVKFNDQWFNFGLIGLSDGIISGVSAEEFAANYDVDLGSVVPLVEG